MTSILGRSALDAVEDGMSLNSNNSQKIGMPDVVESPPIVARPKPWRRHTLLR